MRRIERFVAAHPGFALQVYRPPQGLRTLATHAQRQAWIDRYEKAAAGYRACAYLRTVGDAVTDPHCRAIQQLHDAECRVDHDLPLG